MNESKLKVLFEAARQVPAPQPEMGFDARVMRAIERAEREPVAWFDQLGELWPRVAIGALLAIGLCVAADFSLAALAQADLSASLTEVSEQWLFAMR
jgi:hypothetical protein